MDHAAFKLPPIKKKKSKNDGNRNQKHNGGGFTLLDEIGWNSDKTNANQESPVKEPEGDENTNLAESGKTTALPQDKPTPPGSEGGNGDALDIDTIVKGLIQIALTLTIMAVLVLLVMIIIISILNLLLLGVLVAIETFRYDNDMIIKDTMKYKLLRYVDYLNQKEKAKKEKTEEPPASQPPAQTTTTSSIFSYFGMNTTNMMIATTETTTTQVPEVQAAPITEPYFYIYSGIVPMLSMIYLCYTFLIIICILAGLIYIVFAYFVKIMYKDFKVVLNGNGSDILSSLFSVPVFLGIGTAVALGIFHWIYFENVIKPELTTIRDAIHQIDTIINDELTSKSHTFSSDIFRLLTQKQKGIDDLEKYKQYIKTDIESDQFDKAKQKIILIILYSHLHDAIPSTNTRADQLIKYYFFKNPVLSESAQTVQLRASMELSDLTYVSLMVDKLGIRQISDDYIKYDFYSCDHKGRAGNVINLQKDVQMFFQQLNNKLMSFPEFRNNRDLFAIYMSVFAIICLILSFLFFKLLSKQKGIVNRSITNMAEMISKVMAKIMPKAVNEVIDKATETIPTGIPIERYSV